MKIKNKLKANKKRLQIKIIQAMIIGGSLATTLGLPVKASLGDNVQNLANSTANELLGLADVLGLIGLAFCGVFWGLNKRDMAIKILIGVVGGYFILKYAQPIWNVIKSSI